MTKKHMNSPDINQIAYHLCGDTTYKFTPTGVICCSTVWSGVTCKKCLALKPKKRAKKK